MSKGSKRRPVKEEEFREGWDRIFKVKKTCGVCDIEVNEAYLFRFNEEDTRYLCLSCLNDCLLGYMEIEK